MQPRGPSLLDDGGREGPTDVSEVLGTIRPGTVETHHGTYVSGLYARHPGWEEGACQVCGDGPGHPGDVRDMQGDERRDRVCETETDQT